MGTKTDLPPFKIGLELQKRTRLIWNVSLLLQIMQKNTIPQQLKKLPAIINELLNYFTKLRNMQADGILIIKKNADFPHGIIQRPQTKVGTH
jgi:hypothetical protein